MQSHYRDMLDDFATRDKAVVARRETAVDELLQVASCLSDEELERQWRVYLNRQHPRLLDSSAEEPLENLHRVALVLAEHPSGPSSAVLKEMAYVAFVRVVRARPPHTASWARAQLNLGKLTSERQSGDVMENQNEAMRCYEEALTVWTRADFPLKWANTHRAMGVAYKNRVCGDESENIHNAIECHKKALKIFAAHGCEDDVRMCHINLGNAFLRKNTTYADQDAMRHYESSLAMKWPSGDRSKADVRCILDALKGKPGSGSVLRACRGPTTPSNEVVRDSFAQWAANARAKLANCDFMGASQFESILADIELAPPELAARAKKALMHPNGEREAQARCLEELQEFSRGLDLDRRLLGVRIQLRVDGEPDLTLAEIVATCKIVDAINFTEAEFRSGLDIIRNKQQDGKDGKAGKAANGSPSKEPEPEPESRSLNRRTRNERQKSSMKKGFFGIAPPLAKEPKPVPVSGIACGAGTSSASSAALHDMLFKPGDKVKLQGLQKRAELNGKCGVILSSQLKLGRWTVRLSDDERVNIRPANLLPYALAEAHAEAKAGGDHKEIKRIRQLAMAADMLAPDKLCVRGNAKRLY